MPFNAVEESEAVLLDPSCNDGIDCRAAYMVDLFAHVAERVFANMALQDKTGIDG